MNTIKTITYQVEKTSVLETDLGLYVVSFWNLKFKNFLEKLQIIYLKLRV